ncbi:hypothetical protein GJ744_012374 [Endocarpon pusillum]|uniref:Psi-producing oxygenase A n=1 Tax=Endocarpon pusillum TaxID=364733 RepID=A0A8H7E1H2_9EURO|nr:hypothetical protein GJ744_012374 [Endocarpon pusillum]
MERSQSQETPLKRRKMSSDGLAPPEEWHILPRSPSPDSVLAHLSHNLRGVFSNIWGDEEPNEVINGATPERSNLLASAYSVISSQVPRLPANVGLAISAARTKLFRSGLVDDKHYDLEAIIQAAASIPPNTKACKDVGGVLIKPLWNDLQHPPLTYLGDDFKYRKSDGSNNNFMYPRLGAAGSCYARTVTPETLAPSVLPDADLVFETIFAREGETRNHPNEISSVLFYLATIITHDIFRTDEHDPNKLKNSSYLDLSPLYGSSDDPKSDACVANVRTFKDGMLKPDTFSETRVYAFPAGVAVLLLCFNRFHNYVASQLKIINEGNRFSVSEDPRQSAEAARKKVDEDLFQTARLITCGLYVNIILHDYVRTILNLQATDSSWTLDPRADCKSIFDQHGVPSGIGNHVSVEFNLVYRWHSTISERDATWVEDLYREIFETSDITPYLRDQKQFYKRVGPWFAEIKAKKPEEREHRDFRRKENGRFDDKDLARILAESTEDVAGAFGSKNVPLVMRLIEVMGIEQARKWNVCTLNEFRKFFKLAPHRTFADITKNADVARTLETLYSKPDYVELYPGLVAEDAKQVLEPGSGLCPGYTVSRTILADAVALVRGDRFYTVDYTPAHLTNWGWNLVRSDPEVAGGGVIYNLLMRAMPSCYRGNSVYAMFPFTSPSKTRELLEKIHKLDDYDFSSPCLKPPPIPVKSHKAVTDILKNNRSFKVPWGPHTKALTGHDFMLSGDEPHHQVQRHEMKEKVYTPCDWAQQIRDFYHETTYHLIEVHSNKLLENRYQIDIVKDIANPSHTLFAARMFHLPVDHPDQLLPGASTKSLYLGFAILFAYVFLDGDTARSFKLQANAKKATEKLRRVVRNVVQAVALGEHLHLNRLFDSSASGKLLSDYGIAMITRLLKGKRVDEVVAEILSTGAAAVATQAQAMAQMLDVYLEPEHTRHWTEIRRCAYSEDPDDFKTLQKYALEACRLAPAAFGLLRTAAERGTIQDDDKAIPYKRGNMIYTDFVSAGRDEKIFKNANEIDVSRDLSDYIEHGHGPHACIGRKISQVSLAVQLGLFAKLKNLQRVPGQAGKLKYTTELPHGNPGSVRVYMTEDWSSWSPFPTTMKVQHEGFCETIEEHDVVPAPAPIHGQMNGVKRVDSVMSPPDIHINGCT